MIVLDHQDYWKHSLNCSPSLILYIPNSTSHCSDSDLCIIQIWHICYLLKILWLVTYGVKYRSIEGFPRPVCHIFCCLPPCFNDTKMLPVLWTNHAASCLPSFPHSSPSAWMSTPTSFYFTDSYLLHTCVLHHIFLMFQVELSGPSSPLHCYCT